MPKPCHNLHPTHLPTGCRFCWICLTHDSKWASVRLSWGEPEPLPDSPEPPPWVDLNYQSRPTQQIRSGIARKPISPKPRYVTVPQPPVLTLPTPISSVALVTVAVGREYNSLFGITGPFMEEYAKKLGIDFVVINWLGHPNWPISSKFAIGRVLDYYERIIYVDADVLLRPGCVDLLHLCPEMSFCACDEGVFQVNQPQYGILSHYLGLCRNIGYTPPTPIPYYFNCGVMVLSKRYQHLLLPPTYPLPVHHLTEQEHTNAMALKEGASFFPLPRECNWQHWTDLGFKEAPPNAILHCSGLIGEARLNVLRRLTGQPTTQHLPSALSATQLPLGPGSHLKRLLSLSGIDPDTGCACTSRVRQMNEWGIEGCRSSREEIIGWLKDEASRRGWATRLTVGFSLAVAGAKEGWLNLSDPFGSLVDEAIRRAEESLSSSSSPDPHG